MARRIVTAREQHEMLSPWREAAPIWQKIPADLDWGNDFEEQGEAPPLSYRQREETDQPTGKWYHVSTQPLEVGTKVVPKGGPSPDPDFYDDPNETGYNNSNRQNYVWLAPTLASAHSWSRDLGAPYIHEVKPGDKPQPWNYSGTNGWVSPHAHVVRQVSKDEARAASEEYYAGLRQKAHEEWLSQATPQEIEEFTALSQQLSKPARVAMFDPREVTNRRGDKLPRDIQKAADRVAIWHQAGAESAYDPGIDPAEVRSIYDPPSSMDAPWYHTSNEVFKPGDLLTGGHRPNWKSLYDQEGLAGRGDWVWLEHRPSRALGWQTLDRSGRYRSRFYEVKPDEGPYPWNGVAGDGWVAPRARVVREISREEMRQME